MRGDMPRFYYFYLFTFLLASYINSKSFASDELKGGSSETEKGLGRDDTVGVHESYRPRHKFKTGAGQFSKRFVGNKNEIQAGKGLECAVMYKNNEPIGILQPYEESYRFLPVNGEPTLVDINPVPAKRKTILDFLYPSEVDDDYYEDGVGFSDERYPSVFAKFKIDSRLDRSLGPRKNVKKSMEKRESDNGKVSINDYVEEELKNILGDIGLVDDNPNQDSKRKVEDENLELGTNKIDIAKETREKRNEFGNTLFPIEKTSTDNSKMNLLEVRSVIEPLPSIQEDKHPPESVSKDSEVDMQDSVNAVVEEPRQKRAEKAEGEKAGPSIDDDMPVLASNTEKIAENSNLDDYGKRVEREIRDKIHKLKEEVKKEIDELRKSDSDYNEDAERKKKQTLNSLSEENSDIDPYNNENNENEQVHVRRKRSVQYPDSLETMEEFSDQNSAVRNGNLESTKHQSRSLKQTDDDEDSEEEDEDTNQSIRTKRQVNMENEYSDDESESEFIEDNQINDSGKTSEDEDSGDIVENFAANEKKGCTCDKNSGECMCENNPSKTRDPTSAGRNSAQHNCACNKNDHNCKCGSSGLVDDTPSLSQEFAEYDDAAESDFTPEVKAEKRHVLSPFRRVLENREDPLSGYLGDYRTKESNTFKRAPKPPKRDTRVSFENGEYFVDLQPSIFKLSPSEKALDPITDEGRLVKRHLVAVRQMSPHSRFRRRVQKEENNREPRQLIDMSEEDIFGALPQSYEGELARYKRVKRARKK